jgi:hypothetical protein
MRNYRVSIMIKMNHYFYLLHYSSLFLFSQLEAESTQTTTSFTVVVETS